MSERRGGLGRGLAALIPTGPPAPEDGPRYGLGARTVDVVIGTRQVAEETTEGEPSPTAGRDAPAGGPGSESSTQDAATGSGAHEASADGATDGTTAPREESTGASDGAEPATADPETAVYREVRLDRIRANPRQPRTVFDEEALAELTHSIREFGLLQPIVVRELDAPVPADGGAPEITHELVMGERRWRAAQEAGLERIPAIVRRTTDDDLLRDALLENIHRVQLNPLEEAAAYQQLLTEFDVTHEQLADRIGRSRPAITNTIRLLRLPVAVQRRVAAGVLSAGHARALLGLDDSGTQEELAARIVAEGMSVRGAEEAVTLARGENQSSRRSTSRRRPLRAPGLQDLAERLSDSFDTRVKVELGQRKGRIVVEFGSVDDLERIVGLMGREGLPGPSPEG